MKKKATATDILQEIVQDRNWYPAGVTTKAADQIKRRLAKGGVTENKAAEILHQLGWEMTSPPTWEKKPR